MNPLIKKTTDSQKALEIARKLPDYFDEGGLKQIEKDSKENMLFGAYLEDEMIGFACYKEVNQDVIEMLWLGVLPDKQGNGVGEKLVRECLESFSGKYKVCKVKTLSEDDPYEPYKKTRAFYRRLGFIPVETIKPYPGWGDNTCQIFIKNI